MSKESGVGLDIELAAFGRHLRRAEYFGFVMVYIADDTQLSFVEDIIDVSGKRPEIRVTLATLQDWIDNINPLLRAQAFAEHSSSCKDGLLVVVKPGFVYDVLQASGGAGDNRIVEAQVNFGNRVSGYAHVIDLVKPFNS